MSDNDKLESFIAEWALTGGSELANTQSFVNGLCALIGVDPPKGSRTDDAHNDYVFERRVFQKEADGTESFGRIDAYKRHSFVLEAKQGSDADRKAAESGEADLDIFGQTAATRFKRGTAKRGTPTWSKAMVEARGTLSGVRGEGGGGGERGHAVTVRRLRMREKYARHTSSPRVTPRHPGRPAPPLTPQRRTAPPGEGDAVRRPDRLPGPGDLTASR